MNRLFFVALTLLMLSSCMGTDASATATSTEKPSSSSPITSPLSQPTVTASPATTGSTESTQSSAYNITIDTPSSGETVFVGRINLIEGQIEPIPQQGMVQIYFEVENGWHQHFDQAAIDPETGKWFVNNPIHPNYTGTAKLVVALVETGVDPPLVAESVDIYLDYDPADDAVYVNLNQPKSENNITHIGDTLTIEGTSHNPVDNQITIQIKECANDTILRQQLIETAGGPWQLDVLIPPEFAEIEGDMCVFACTGNNDGSDVAWCGWQNVVIEPAK